MKKPLLIAGCALLLLAVAVFGVALSIDADQFRPRLEAMMSEALGRKVTIGHIRVALLSGGLVAENLSIADDPAFSAEPFVTAKAVIVGVDLLPLLMSRTLRVETFRLDEPSVALLQSSTGAWNFSRLGASGASASGSQAGGAGAGMSFLVQTLRITGGRVTVGTLYKGRKPREYAGVDLQVSNLSYTSRFPFRLTANTPGGGRVRLDGEAGPLDPNDVSETPIRASLDVEHVDVASTGLIDASSGPAGLVDFKGEISSDGRIVRSKGRFVGRNVQLLAGASPSRVPVEIDYESDYRPKARTGAITQGDVHVGKATAHLTGEFNVGESATAVRLRLSAHRLPVTELEAALPAVGVRLPRGASLRQGTLDADLTIKGPIEAIVVSGPIRLSDAVLSGFDLGAKLGAVASMAGLPRGGETAIQTLEMTVRAAPAGTRIDALSLVAPAIGMLTGGGTIAASGALDMRMLAKLKEGSALAGGVARYASLGQPANGIPFRIEGTTSAPVFVPDVSSAVTNVLKNPDTPRQAAGLLNRLFGRKH